KQTELTETRFNGRDPAVALRAIGEDRHAFEVVQRLWNAGSSAESLSLYEPAASKFAEILGVGTSADDCDQHEKCFKYESTLAYDEASNPKAFDIRLTLKGTYRNRAGRILNPARCAGADDGRHACGLGGDPEPLVTRLMRRPCAARARTRGW